MSSSSSLRKFHQLSRLSLNSSGGTRGDADVEKPLVGHFTHGAPCSSKDILFPAKTKEGEDDVNLDLRDLRLGDDDEEGDVNLDLRDLRLGDDDEDKEGDLLTAMLRRLNDRVQAEDDAAAANGAPIMIRSVGEIHKAYRERVLQEEKRHQLSRRRLFHKQQRQQQQQLALLQASPPRRPEIRKESLLTHSTELDQEAVVVEELSFARYSTDSSWRSELEMFLRHSLGQGKQVKLRTQCLASEDAREGKMVLKNIFYSVMHLTDSRDGLIPLLRESVFDGAWVSHEMTIRPR